MLLIGAAYVPVDADDPEERARLVFGEARVGGSSAAPAEIMTGRLSRPARSRRRGSPARKTTPGSFSPPAPREPPRALRCITAQPRPSLTPRPGCSSGRTGRSAGPGPGRAVGGLRRFLRGNVAGMAARRLPGARPACPGPDRHGSRPVADHPRHHGGLHRSHPCRALAGGVPGERPPADFRRRGVPAGARRPARRRRTRGLEHLRAHRGHRRGLRRTDGRSRPGPDRPAAGRVGPRRGGRRRRFPWPRARSGN